MSDTSPAKVNLDKVDPKLLDLLIEEWQKTKNVNAFLMACFIQEYPIFQENKCFKGEANTEKYYLKKSLLDRLVNKVMTNTSKNTGKKLLAYHLTSSLLNQKAQQHKVENPLHLLILLLVKTVPNATIRRLKFGSGFLTRSVRFTFCKKISWFLKAFIKIAKVRGLGFKKTVGDQIDLIMTNSPRSKLLSSKKEEESNSQKANIQ